MIVPIAKRRMLNAGDRHGLKAMVLRARVGTAVLVPFALLLARTTLAAQSVEDHASEIPNRPAIAQLQDDFNVPSARSEFTLAAAGRNEPAPASEKDKHDGDSGVEPNRTARHSEPVDFNRSIYYKNKLEFGLDVGYLPINIPFAFDFLLGDGYNMTPLKYTLVPVIGSLRWQIDDVRGPWIFRGNWDLSFSGAFTAVARGPENRYFAYIMGIRRNFVPRDLRIAPYFDGRLGMGHIDAKGPAGVAYAQGQDFTFTLNLGSGVRYNFDPRYSISAGLNYMHISNLYLSEPRYLNYGINVYGPMVGIDVRLGKPRGSAAQ